MASYEVTDSSPRARNRGPGKNAKKPRKLAQHAYLSFHVPPPGPPSGQPLEEVERAWAPTALALATIESSLRRAKSDLDAPGGASPRVVEQVLRNLDLYSWLKGPIAKQKKGQAVTNAWLKCYEILGRSGVLASCAPPPSEAGRPLRVFCNAEYPGSFVSAINHFVSTRGEGVAPAVDWVASSLFPDGGEAALGDAHGFGAGNPERWLMSAEMRGDLTSPDDIEALAQLVSRHFGGAGVDLYTSDAGIDVSSDYNNQEALTARIHLGQVVTGLLVLRRGGALVVKTYTFLSRFSVSLISLCASLFRRVEIVKPRASRPANSEVYLVCLGRLGPPPTGAEAARLAGSVGGGVFDGGAGVPGGPPPGGAPETEAAIVEAAREIHGRQQVDFLREAAGVCKQGGAAEKAKKLAATARRDAEASWLEQNPIFALPAEKRLATCSRGAGPVKV